MHIVIGAGVGAALLVVAFVVGLLVGTAQAKRRHDRALRKLDAWQRREQQRSALRATASEHISDAKRKLLFWRKPD